jgi:hypothetical protein
VQSEASPPLEPAHSDGANPATAALAARLDQQAGQSHPLFAGDRPCDVSLRIGGKLRSPQFRNENRECFVPVSPSETYEICVTSRWQHPVFLRLLVDGLNTLPEPGRAAHRGVLVEPKPGAASPGVAQRVNLAEARAWRMDPDRTYAIKGFYSRVGKDAQYRQFQVVDAQQSAAANAGYRDQIGLITAAFYRPRPKSQPQAAQTRSLGTGLGAEYDTQTDTYSGDTEPGDLLAVIQIRYGDK